LDGRRTDRPGHKSAFSTYAYRLVRNEIYTQWEYATRRGRELVTGPEELPCTILEADLGEQDACEELMRLLDWAEKTAAGTTPKGLQAVPMRIDGFSCREIGERLGSPANHVTAWIAKARKHLTALSRTS